MENITLKTQVAALEVLQSAIKSNKELMDNMLAAVKQNDYFQQISKQQAELNVQYSELVESVKALALSVYEKEQIKKVTKGVEIKVFPKMTYEAETAETYCRINEPSLLAFSASAFEAYAAGHILSFVKTVDVPKAQIATNLKKALDK